MTCSKCGTVCAQGAIYCQNCGTIMSAGFGPAQQSYYAPQIPQPPIYQQPPMSNKVVGPDSRFDYSPIGAWGYFGYSLLFSIPVAGFILLCIFALGGTNNINLRNYARSFFCSIAIAIILMIAFWGTFTSFFYYMF